MNALKKFCVGGYPLSYTADIHIPQAPLKTALIYINITDNISIPIEQYEAHIELPDFSAVTDKGNDVRIVIIGSWERESGAIILQCDSAGMQSFWSGGSSTTKKDEVSIPTPSSEKHTYTLDVGNRAYTVCRDKQQMARANITGSTPRFQGKIRIWGITKPYRIRHIIHRDVIYGLTAPLYGTMSQGRGHIGASHITTERQETIVF